MIVVLAPGLHDPARIGQAQEPVLVEAFVPEAAVEALAVRVLDRLAGVDEVQGDRVLVRPLVQRAADQLRPVVQHELRRRLPLGREPVRTRTTRAARQARVDLEGQRFPGEDVDDAEQPDLCARRPGRPQEVERPLLVGALGARRADPARIRARDLRLRRRTAKPSSR